MRLLWLSLLVALIEPAFAGSNGSCRTDALATLQAYSPDGFAIFRQTPRQEFFQSWIDCGASQYDLPTAVHESTHLIAAETDAFPLVGGGTVRRPHAVSDFFPPCEIADRFELDDFTSIYLSRGKASSSTDLLYLLDELNAYSHDLEAAVDLRALSSPDESVDHRDGLAAMMAFLSAYAERARASEPDTWRGLQRPEVVATVSALWVRAEGVMARSCGIPNFGTSDRAYIGKVCTDGTRSALAQILGRAPACPTACLETTSDLDDDTTASIPSRDMSQTMEREVDVPADGRPRHPFAGNVGPRRHPAANE